MSDDLSLVPVHPFGADAAMTEDVIDIIETANRKLPGEPFDIDALRRDLLAARRQLWLAVRDGGVIGLGITGIRIEDSGRATMELMLTAGRDWPSWAWMLEPIEQWARRQGCSLARICGRRGWVRRLKNGWRATGGTRGNGLIFEKALCDG